MNLRRATPDDAADLLRWRNDPDTRAMSFEQGEVAADDHESWLAAKLADPRCEIWIGTVDERPVGQIRFDLDAYQEAEVSISVAPEARGRGCGRRLLLDGLERQSLGARSVRAHVRSENAASLRLFHSCGFAERGRDAGRVTLARHAGAGPEAGPSSKT